MTPKEKARELVEKMMFHTTEEAKQCALICVDEIIKAVKNTVDEDSGYGQDEYWQEVKTEIEKL